MFSAYIFVCRVIKVIGMFTLLNFEFLSGLNGGFLEMHVHFKFMNIPQIKTFLKI